MHLTKEKIGLLKDLHQILAAAGEFQAAGICDAIVGGIKTSTDTPFVELVRATFALPDQYRPVPKEILEFIDAEALREKPNLQVVWKTETPEGRKIPAAAFAPPKERGERLPPLLERRPAESIVEAAKSEFPASLRKELWELLESVPSGFLGHKDPLVENALQFLRNDYALTAENFRIVREALKQSVLSYSGEIQKWLTEGALKYGLPVDPKAAEKSEPESYSRNGELSKVIAKVSPDRTSTTSTVRRHAVRAVRALEEMRRGVNPRSAQIAHDALANLGVWQELDQTARLIIMSDVAASAELKVWEPAKDAQPRKDHYEKPAPVTNLAQDALDFLIKEYGKAAREYRYALKHSYETDIVRIAASRLDNLEKQIGGFAGK